MRTPRYTGTPAPLIHPPPSIGGRRVHNITRFYSVYSEGGAWIWWSKRTSNRKSPRPPQNGTRKTVPSGVSLEAKGTDRNKSGILPYVFKQTAQGINRKQDESIYPSENSLFAQILEALARLGSSRRFLRTRTPTRARAVAVALTRALDIKI